MGKKDHGYCDLKGKINRIFSMRGKNIETLPMRGRNIKILQMLGSNNKYFQILRKYRKYVFCMMAGVFCYLAAKGLNTEVVSVENGVLKRNPCGQGDAFYEFSVNGLENTFSVELYVPEQKLSEEQFRVMVPELSDLLLQRILGENDSLQEVRSDLKLVRELPEYGVTVSWKSEHPEIVGADGSVYWNDGNAVQVYLEAELSNGAVSEVLEIPVVVLPPQISLEERFQTMLEDLVLQERDHTEILLPNEFEGAAVRYSRKRDSSNGIFLLLGLVAAVCMFLKEKEDVVVARKTKENQLAEDYPDFVYKFLILVGAGYSAKEAWGKLCEGYFSDSEKSNRPLGKEMQITMNQMKTGVPEIRAYAEFGRRCGSRSYVKFASLLESSISTGGKNLRKLLETEVEEAFKLRTDLARRKGEEASSKLLLPTFVMLGVVMVMVMAPAFLTVM